MQSNSGRIMPALFRRLSTRSRSVPSSASRSLVPARTFFSRRNNEFWGFDDAFRQMERQFEQMENRMNSVFRNMGFKEPLLPVSAELTPRMTMYETETADKYTMNVVIGKNLPPENIKVSLKDRLVTVEVKYEKTYDHEDGKSKFSQELLRQFTLPEEIDVSQVKSLLTPDGVLTFEVPLPPKAIAESAKAKEIQITKNSN